MQHKNKLEYLLGFDGYVRIVACASNQLTKNRMSQMEIRRIFLSRLEPSKLFLDGDSH
jgi:hypothetical protein